jgi:Kef-type K+ transport system membrane component KefB/Trk K+ transport system NAD-binding subunit
MLITSIIQFHSVFDEIALLLLAAALAGLVALRLRQPLILAFIIVGIIVGPVGLDVIRSTDQLRLFSEMGLALLLFVVGLKLDPQLIRKMGSVALATGLGQMAFSGILGLAISRGLGMPLLSAIYVAAATVFSSTILIVKLLSDKRETDSLYGRISLGLLIVQDIVVVFAMIGLSALTGASSLHPALQFMLISLKGAGLLVGLWAASKFLFPRILPVVARSAELLLFFGITWALLLAVISELLGFNKEVGAFVAGLSLASTMYRDLLSTKLASLRDFLLLFFFIELGSHFELGSVGSQFTTAILLSLSVLLGKPLIVMAIMGWMGYRKRTGFMTGLAASQISEFSLVLMAMGVSAGHIGNEILGLVTLILMISMGISVHLIIHGQILYERLAAYLRIFEKKGSDREDAGPITPAEIREDLIILIGLGRYGNKIGTELICRERAILGVDFDPQAVALWRSRGEKAVFGDAGDPDFAHVLPLSNASWVISSIRNTRIDSGIIRTLRHAGYKGYFACAAEESLESLDETLRTQVDLIFDPFEDASVQAADLVFAAENKIARRTMDKLIESLSNHYIICGYGRMGQQIVKDLAHYSVPCVVVEWNPEQLPKLREHRIPHIEGTASEDSSLIKAGILRAKGLIAVAASDEENVFIVLTAKVLNPGLFIVARSILQANEDKLRHAGANRVMSPYVLGGRRMAAAVIKPEVMDFLDLVVHDDSHATEMATVAVVPGTKCIGKTLREISPWETCRVTLLAVRRKGDSLQPNPSPDFVLREGDELIVMGTAEEIKAAGMMLASPG